MVCYPGEQVPGPNRSGQAQEEALLHMCREGCSPNLAEGCPYGLQQERAPVWAAPCCLLHKQLFFPLVLGYREVWKKLPWVNKVFLSIFQGVGEGNHGHPELLVDSGSIREEDVFLSTCDRTEALLEKAFFLCIMKAPQFASQELYVFPEQNWETEGGNGLFVVVRFWPFGAISVMDFSTLGEFLCELIGLC